MPSLPVRPRLELIEGILPYRMAWIAAVVLCLIALVLQWLIAPLQGLIFRALSTPVVAALEVVSYPFERVVTLPREASKLLNAYQQLDDLERQITYYRYLDVLNQQLESENRLLRGLANFVDRDTVAFKSGRVISDTRHLFARSALISLGTADNIAIGQAVLVGNALAGMVIAVTPSSARVLFLDDPNSMLPVISHGRRNAAIAQGTGHPRVLTLQMTDHRDFEVGERLVTSGVGGVLPPDVPVAVITKVENGIVEAQMIADTRHVELATVAQYDIVGLDPSPSQ